jgi:hypothetical protein
MAKEAERLLADTGWLLEPLRTTDTGIDSANPETTPSQRNDSEQRAALTASQGFFRDGAADGERACCAESERTAGTGLSRLRSRERRSGSSRPRSPGLSPMNTMLLSPAALAADSCTASAAASLDTGAVLVAAASLLLADLERGRAIGADAAQCDEHRIRRLGRRRWMERTIRSPSSADSLSPVSLRPSVPKQVKFFQTGGRTRTGGAYITGCG